MADTNFQLGDFVVKNPKAWQFIKQKQYAMAQIEVANGDWINQTPKRVDHFLDALRKFAEKTQ